jgi:WD40 repeat protein
MVCGTSNGLIYVYNVNTGGLIYNLNGHTTNVFDFVQIEFDFLASSSQDNTIRLWNLTTHTSKFILSGHNQAATGLKLISPNELTSGSFDTTLKLWDITSGQLIKTFTGHSNQVIWSVMLLNDGKTLASGSLDQTIKLWNISTGACLRTINAGDFPIRAMALIKNITFIKSRPSIYINANNFKWYFIEEYLVACV